jgi:aldehyde dehydrogenase (NAD+)
MQQSTPSSEITSKHSAQKAFFETGATRPLPFRRKYLLSLVSLLRENESELASSLTSDLGKSAFESQITEIEVVVAEALDAASNLRAWNASESVPSPGVIFPSSCEIKVDPRGVVLIIGPFNYPLSLVLGPLVSALAGGNCAILKPSELCPKVSSSLAKLVPLYFPPTLVTVVEGAIPETTALTSLPWGLIFFTGSGRVGSLIASAAASTLTPCVLELGGKSPVIVTPDAPHVGSMCDRILWGKTINAGQTCVAPDYVLCHESVLAAFLQGLQASAGRMFPRGGAKEGGVFSRNVSEAHTSRLVAMVDDAVSSGGELVIGGSASADVADRFLEPVSGGRERGREGGRKEAVAAEP